jgi:hypothetical protein
MVRPIVVAQEENRQRRETILERLAIAGLYISGIAVSKVFEKCGGVASSSHERGFRDLSIPDIPRSRLPSDNRHYHQVQQAHPMGITPDFASMNETDVRETIVRPLIESLGYRHGADAYIRTEQTLRYGKAFLGRKKPNRDPDLVGRADYICGVVSFGRWVVEVKPPAEALTQETVEQAHTYAAHPEIAASHFLLTNGREFRLYETSRLEFPAMEWNFQDTDDNSLRLYNLLSPAAFRARAKATMLDPGKPLGRGLGSRLGVIGGEILYEDYVADHPLFQESSIAGLRLPVVGGCVNRTEDRRILGHVKVSKPAPLLFGGNDESSDAYDYFSADEYISDDPEHPTIFQNLVSLVLPAGREMNIPGLGKRPFPFEYSFSAFTEAVGYVANDKFAGTMRMSCDFHFSKMEPQVQHTVRSRFGKVADHGHFAGAGRFEVTLIRDLE